MSDSQTSLGRTGGGVSTLQFGGNSAMNSRARTHCAGRSNAQMQLYPSGRCDAPSEARRRRPHSTNYSQDVRGNELGTFAYNSLADLAAKRPASFTRTLQAPTRTGGEWNGYVALGDLWRVNGEWQVIYGARVEGERVHEPPGVRIRLVASAFGLRNDNAPASVDVSPRLGVRWQDGKGKIVRAGVGRVSQHRRPDAARGAVGEHGARWTDSLQHLVHRRGGADGRIGPRTRKAIVDSRSSASAASGVLTTRRPTCSYVDRSFRPTRSWRVERRLLSRAHSAMCIASSSSGSLNLDQPGTFDDNFGRAPSFTTAARGAAGVSSLPSSDRRVDGRSCRRRSRASIRGVRPRGARSCRISGRRP